MSDDLTADITKFPEQSNDSIAAIDKYIAAFNAGAPVRQAQEAERSVMTAGVRIAKPAPALEGPTTPPEPIVDLPAEFLPFADDIRRAEATALRHGFSDFHAALAMIKGLQPSEVTPLGATAEERLALADLAMDQLVQRYGDDGAEKIVQGWRAAVTALGVGPLLKANGFDTNADLVAFVGRSWLAQVKS